MWCIYNQATKWSPAIYEIVDRITCQYVKKKILEEIKILHDLTHYCNIKLDLIDTENRIVVSRYEK